MTDYKGTATGKMIFQDPDHSYVKMEIPGMVTEETAYDGKIGWKKSTMEGFRKLGGAELAQAKERASISPELFLVENSASAKVLEEAEEDGKKYHVVKVTMKEGPEKTLYIDQESHLIGRVKTELATGPGGMVTVDIRYLDYQEMDGVKFANHMKTSLVGMDLIMKLTKVEQNVEIDQSIFAAPE